ncbi:MAG: hypothetical protein J5589_03180 [Firmicutes bacterium]|nr:hypothetical protein [Bacillota bacterium]
MSDPKKIYTEFSPPEIDKPSVITEPEFTPPGPELSTPLLSEDFGSLPPEDPVPAPEIIEPGKYQWTKFVPDKNSRTVRLAMQMLSAVLVLALALGLFYTAPVSADNQPPVETVEESSEQPADDESKETAETSETVNESEPSSQVEESSETIESSEPAESSEPVTEVSSPQFVSTLTSAGSAPSGESSITATFVFEQPEGDEREYDLSIAGLGLKWYDASMSLLSVKDEVYSKDSLSMVEVNYDKEYGIPWTFTYEGGAHTDYQPDGAAFYSVTAVFADSLSGEVFQAETNALPAPTIDPSVVREPEVHIYIWGFYSEMEGYVTFANLQDADKVELQIYDTLTGALEETRDITSYAVSGEDYPIEPFYTDFIWEHHQDEYNAAMSFPMEVRVDVVATWIEGDGEMSRTWSAISANESDHMWYVKYVPEADGWEGAGKFMLEFMNPGNTPATVIFDKDFPENQITLGTYKVTCTYQGKEYDLSSLSTINQFEAQSYSGDSDEPVPITILDVMIDKPAGVKEDTGEIFHFTISWYMESYGKVLTIHRDLEPTAEYR